jgi:hypothetical protein
MTDTTGTDNVAVQLSTVDLTSPGDQKNATIIKTKISSYNTTLSHNQKIYNRWYYWNVAINCTAHVITFVMGILLSIQYYMPASSILVVVASAINLIIPCICGLLYVLVFKNKISRFLIVVNSLKQYINQVTIFYNKAVAGGTITDSEMTDFNNLVAPLDKNLATEIQTANSSPVNLSEVIQEIKSKIDGVIAEVHTLNTTSIKSS